MADAMTAEARAFAKARRMVGSVNRARQLIQEELPTATPIRISVYRDPEIAGYESLSFSIAITESADRLMGLDERVQDRLFDEIPAQHRSYFLFRYGLE